MRSVWIWSTVVLGSHLLRDLLDVVTPKAPLSRDIEDLRNEIAAARRLIESHNYIAENGASRLFWQGLLLRVSLLADLGLLGLVVCQWLVKGRAVQQERTVITGDISAASSDSEPELPPLPVAAVLPLVAGSLAVPKRPSDFGKGKLSRSS